MTSFHLSPEDKRAIKAGDHAYLNRVGADHYIVQDYEKALAYYHLAASLGDLNAISNLGYCYLYGRSIPRNLDLAIAYFTIAAKANHVDALYKLGNIYSSERWGLYNPKWGLIYYQKALGVILKEEGLTLSQVADSIYLMDFPSLCLSLGQLYLEGDLLERDMVLAHALLVTAAKGYERFLNEGQNMYKSAYQKTVELLKKPGFSHLSQK